MHQNKEINVLQVSSGKWLSHRLSFLLDLLVALCSLTPAPLQVLLLQPLLFPLEVHRHIVKGHLVQLLKPVISPYGGWYLREGTVSICLRQYMKNIIIQTDVLMQAQSSR